jgi:hypothetical protein
MQPISGNPRALSKRLLAAGKARRLNVSLDTRLYFVSAGNESITMKHIALSIGYDHF